MLNRAALFLSILASAASAAPKTTILGHALPAAAVPYAEQILRVPCDNTRNEITFDHPISVYQRYSCVQDLFSDTLVDLDHQFQPEPAAAISWSVADDGVTWTFQLRPGQMWNDGTPVTAHDYVAPSASVPVRNTPGTLPGSTPSSARAACATGTASSPGNSPLTPSGSPLSTP
jgi:ABC-type transport system substrate-binding protein